LEIVVKRGGRYERREDERRWEVKEEVEWMMEEMKKIII